MSSLIRSRLLCNCLAVLLLPLAARAQKPAPSPSFDSLQPCDTASSPACDQRDLALEKTQLEALTRSMQTATPEQRLAFNALLVTFSGFRELHISNETCLAAPGCTQRQQHELAATNRDFLNLAQALPADGIPTFSAMDLEGLDADLNTAYINRFTVLSSACASPATVDTCVPMAGLRDTERAWIRYRDAWITFGMLRYPQVTADQWTGYLTRERTRQVKQAL